MKKRFDERPAFPKTLGSGSLPELVLHLLELHLIVRLGVEFFTQLLNVFRVILRPVRGGFEHGTAFK